MAIGISNAAAVAGLNAIVDLVDIGAGVGKMLVYSGSMPGQVDVLATGTLLATINLPATAFGGATPDAANFWAQAIVLSVPLTAVVAVTGMAGYFRIEDGNALDVIQGTAGTTGADAIFNSVALSAGADIELTSMEIRLPE